MSMETQSQSQMKLVPFILFKKMALMTSGTPPMTESWEVPHIHMFSTKTDTECSMVLLCQMEVAAVTRAPLTIQMVDGEEPAILSHKTGESMTVSSLMSPLKTPEHTSSFEDNRW